MATVGQAPNKAASSGQLDTVLQEARLFPPPPEFSAKARIKSLAEYEAQWSEAAADIEKFWGNLAGELHWFTPFSKVLQWNEPFANWFVGGKTNVSYNCLDTHLNSATRNKAAIVWEGEPGEERTLTYQQLHHEVCKFANVLKHFGLKQGDVVSIYMPMVPELAIAILACARIGVVHSVIFGGFSSEAIADRNNDAKAKLIITADAGWRRGQELLLKANVDAALAKSPTVKHCIVLRRIGLSIDMQEGRDHWWHDLMSVASANCPAEPLDSETPLYILYTSGSTGKPKGIKHTTAGYNLFAKKTFEWVFDHRDDDLFWCTADIGWVTGHTYVVYGPLSAGATVLMYEGAPNWPDEGRFWRLIEKHRVTIFYTAPTAIRSFIKWGDHWVDKCDLSSLRLLGTVGEGINPEAWMWYHRKIGRERCPIVDTWWQTETGGILITPLPGATRLKPGSATQPFFGVVPQIVDAEGKVLEGAATGNLCIADAWPGIMRTVYGDHERFVDTYFKAYPGKYFTGDGCRRDADGFYWITGRVDDVINVAGHRLGTAEVESALVAHPKCSEAAVVGYPHDIKGQGIYAYVTLMTGEQPSEELRKELVAWVRKEIGPIASPDLIQFAPNLPKTRSGKIMRRILRKIAEDEYGNLGDTSTLADPAVVDDLVSNRQNRRSA
jgi:acetyl-CoA synthetase